ncbi:ATP-binding protein [Actinomadura rupiterrae]|uniref:ATP-binding protein n=1 Tax=Actinomadura rupiterrae TaxID=559627 RepID=UPI0020A54F58|nr:hypothetical protein [Actinomadura rupiterrae]MCP2342043.1 anti-sigma regulatory factor (Ser/Thr protein kinase) [Actinomadura rupiterrae]
MEDTKWARTSAAEWLHSRPQMRWRRVFPGQAEQVPYARKLAQDLFAGAPCESLVALAVSELAGNALRHSISGAGNGGWFGLELVYAKLVYVAVTDLGGEGIPTVLPEGYRSCPTRENGRGLRMLYDLSVSLGVHGSSALGHTVWVDLDFDTSLEDLPQQPMLLVS